MQAVATTEQYLDFVEFFINNKKHTVYHVNPRMTLNEYIRSQPGLTGTKKMCGEAGCGACTVMLSYYDTNLQEEVKVRRCGLAIDPPLCD